MKTNHIMAYFILCPNSQFGEEVHNKNGHATSVVEIIVQEIRNERKVSISTHTNKNRTHCLHTCSNYCVYLSHTTSINAFYADLTDTSTLCII